MSALTPVNHRVDLRELTFPGTWNVTLADADVAYEFIFPRGLYEVAPEFKVNAGEYAWSGEPNTDLGASSHDLAAGAKPVLRLYTSKLPRGANPTPADPKLYFQSSTASAVLVISAGLVTG